MSKNPDYINFDEYFKFDELEASLKTLENKFSNLANLEVLGKSHQGREIFLLEITNTDTGKPEDKPAYYIDANTHAEELTGTNVAMYIAWQLLSKYGQDDFVTSILDQQTFYIIPRLNPDAAEFCLTEPFYEWIGNGRYLPGEEQTPPGLQYSDINDDGVIVDMRIRDENGEWKVSEKDPRLLVQREPYERGGEYYKLTPEGYIEGYDGAEIDIPRPRDGNLNRNYPYGWGPEGEQYGAGEYPLSEPETEAVVEFVTDHPNIFGGINYHTNAGVILAPMGIKGESIPIGDKLLFERIGEVGSDATGGYDVVMDEDEFSFPGSHRRMGTATDFFYGQKGLSSFVVELWDVHKESGIEKDWYYPLRELSEEENLKLLNWNDEKLDGEGFVEWQEFDHPQLGKVEIGGWKRLFMFRNPPPGEHLKEVCEKNSTFAIRHAAMSPLLDIEESEVERVEEGVFKVRVVVSNRGYLPTNVSKRAENIDAIEPVKVELEKDDSVEIITGEEYQEIGQLSGRAERNRKYSRFKDWGNDRKALEWVLELSEGTSTKIEVKVDSETGGKVNEVMNLQS